jgi:hypothetical protein
MTSSVWAACASIALVDKAQAKSGARIMVPPVANPTATKLVVERKSLRLGECAFIEFLPQ